jgi:tellurite resistance protein TerC
LFGAFLLFTGIKMLFQKDEEMDPADNPILKFCCRYLPLTSEYHGSKFTIRINGKMVFTPLALVLIMVESTDLIFAVDSIPAIFAVTTDSFIVFTSNICAILGLRSLYFLLAEVVDRFIYLKVGLSLVLIFIGGKMLLAEFYKIPTGISLTVVAAILITSVVISLFVSRNREVK